MGLKGLAQIVLRKSVGREKVLEFGYRQNLLKEYVRREGSFANTFLII